MSALDKTVPASTVRDWLETGQACLIDVREPREHAGQRIAGAVLMPLSSLDPAAAARVADDRKLILHCQGGVRSDQAAQRLIAAGVLQVTQLQGGINAWAAAGLPTIQDSGVPKPMRIQRQVFAIVSLGVLLGLALSVFVSPWWLLLSAFFAAGLMVAALTGTCALASLLAKLPFNRPAPAPGSGAGKTVSTCATSGCGCK